MKTFSKTRVGSMIQHSTTTKSKELSSKKHNHSKDENISQKSNYNEDGSILRLQCSTMHPSGLIVSEQWVSHSCVLHILTQDQLCCPMLVHGGACNTPLSLVLP